MSEPTSQPAAPPPARKGKGLPKKIAGVPTPVVLGAGALVLTLAYLFFRKKSSPAAGAGQPCTDADGNPGATDASGNCIGVAGATAQGTDQSGEPCQDANGNPGMTDALGNCISTGGLSQSAGSGGDSGGTSGGGTGTVGTTGGDGSGTGTGTGTTTPPPAGGGDVAAPAGVSVTPGVTSADAGWGPNGTGYTYHWQVLPATGTKPVIDATGTSNHVQLGGLKAGTTYRFRVSSQTPRGLWSPYHTFKTKAK
jgi:hypothetical protein